MHIHYNMNEREYSFIVTIHFIQFMETVTEFHTRVPMVMGKPGKVMELVKSFHVLYHNNEFIFCSC